MGGQSGPSRAKSCLLFEAGRADKSLHDGDERVDAPGCTLPSAFLQHFQNEASIPERRRRKFNDEEGELDWMEMRAGGGQRGSSLSFGGF